MTTLQPIETIKANVNTIPVVPGQLIYCSDSKECYYDDSNSTRIPMGTIITLDNEQDKDTLLSPLENRLYLVGSTGIIYRYINSNWEVITNDTQFLQDSNMTGLIPATISNNGVNYAPRTYASLVYTDDGKPITDSISDILKIQENDVIQIKTVPVKATVDSQTIFEIPYPIATYDLTRNKIVVLNTDNTIIPSDQYVISGGQLVFNTLSYVKDSTISFVFIYTLRVGSTINAETINNIRIFGETPAVPKNSDIWIDGPNGVIKYFDGTQWKVISTTTSGGSGDAALVSKKNTVELTAAASTVLLGLEGFKKDTDILFVFKNSVYLEEGKDYTINDDSTAILPIGGQFTLTEDKMTFNFVVLEKVAAQLGNIRNGVEVTTKTNEVPIGIPVYNKDRDLLMVFINSVYIEEGSDYTVSADSSKIITVGADLDGTVYPIDVAFLVLQNVPKAGIDEELVKNRLVTVEEGFKTLQTNVSESDAKIGDINDATLDASIKGKSTVDMIKTVFTNANNGKTAIANAVTAKGVSASSTDTFPVLATKIGQINTGVTPTGDAIEANVLSGKTFYGTGTTQRTGTMPISTVNIVPSNVAQNIPAGYHNGLGYVSAVAVDATKVLSGATIAGTSGSMADNAAVTITPGATDKTIPIGYHNGSGVVKGDANLVASNIISGKSIFGVVGTAKSYDYLVLQGSETTTSDGDTVFFTINNINLSLYNVKAAGFKYYYKDSTNTEQGYTTYFENKYSWIVADKLPSWYNASDMTNYRNIGDITNYSNGIIIDNCSDDSSRLIWHKGGYTGSSYDFINSYVLILEKK